MVSRRTYWYQWATFSSISRKLFKHTIAHPDLFFRLISVFQQSGLLHKRVAKFVANQMKTRQQRQKVYCSWIACRRLEGNLQENIRLVNQYNIPVSLFFGKYDQVMPWKKITPLLKNVHQQQLIILDTGHNTLLNDVAEYYQHHHELPNPNLTVQTSVSGLPTFSSSRKSFLSSFPENPVQKDRQQIKRLFAWHG